MKMVRANQSGVLLHLATYKSMLLDLLNVTKKAMVFTVTKKNEIQDRAILPSRNI